MIQPASRALWGVAFFVFSLAACTFDPSALEERLCTETSDCDPGFVCQSGLCIDGSTLDVGTGDTGPLDTGADVLDGGCTVSEPFCDGQTAVACEDGEETRTSCADPASCGGESGCYCQSGTCLPRVCEPGSRRCNGEVVEACDGEGAGYETVAPCAGDEVCLTGACLPRDCEANTVQCVEDRIVTCGNDSLIEGVRDCTAEDAYCTDRLGTPVCEPRVCEPGAVECDGTTILQCDDRGTAQVPIEDCGPERTCLDGACADVVCVANGSRCADIQTIGRCDETGAIETEVACGPGAYCDTGSTGAECLPQVCEPETTRCVDGVEATEQCDVRGSGYAAPVPCGPSSFCADGVCQPWACTPGTSVCDGNFTLQTCDARGAELRSTLCALGTYCDASSALARCTEQICDPGTRSCASLSAPRLCNEAGSAYTALAGCDSDESCVGGTCTPRVCEPTAARCIDSVTRGLCSTDGTSERSEACGTGNYCNLGTCLPQVCTPNAATCADGTTRRVCDARGASSTDTACPTGNYCEGGTCRPRVCTPSTATCADELNVRECNALGSAQVTRPCGAGNYCVGGACVPQICTPGARSCTNATTVGTCNAAGSAVTTTTCGAAEVCIAGACSARICTPNAVTCLDGNTVSTCNALGSAIATTDCSSTQYCNAGVCTAQVCTPDAVSCADDFTLRTCNALGSASVNSACPASQYCSAGTCRPQVCTPNSAVCSGPTQVTSCNASGSASTVTPCAGGETCIAGVCSGSVCTAGATRCTGNTVEVCNATGTAWNLQTTCTGSCSAGACVDPFCGDGIVQTARGETCDDANSNACDGCDTCNLNNVATIGSGTVRSTGGSWQPGTSSFTMELWTLPTSAGALFGLGTPPTSDYAYLGIDASGLPFFDVNLGTGSAARATGPVSVLDGNWHHLAGIRNGRAFLLFVDGRLVASVVVGGSNTQLNEPGTIFFGGAALVSGAPTPAPATARIDEARISSDILYRGGFSPPRSSTSSATTIALYRFDNASGATVTDSSGNARDMTVSGMSRTGDTCFGAPGAARCGDGALARWEFCEPGTAGCNASCARDCSLRGPEGNCYTFRNNTDDWNTHRTACTGAGGDLITINSSVENDWLRFLSGVSQDVWIGLNDRTSEGNFTWSSGSTSAYRSWNSGEPNDFSTGEDCASYLIGTGLWNDVNCNTNVRAVCENPL